MAARKPIIAICYDFDGTLAHGNIQENSFLPELNIESDDFWDDVSKNTKDHNADRILTYMHLMLEEARNTKSENQITKSAIRAHGKKAALYRGVKVWFGRIDEYAKDKGAKIEHYIISSGLKEMIEGSPIGDKFEGIFASSFRYNSADIAEWPALALNYTTKTQYLFRINKGVKEIYEDKKVNEYKAPEKRRIPFTRMVYIGDGDTDIPCMKLVKDQGGFSIVVYEPDEKEENEKNNKEKASKLIENNRANFIAPADYRKDKKLDKQIKTIIDKVIADFNVQKLMP